MSISCPQHTALWLDTEGKMHNTQLVSPAGITPYSNIERLRKMTNIAIKNEWIEKALFANGPNSSKKSIEVADANELPRSKKLS